MTRLVKDFFLARTCLLVLRIRLSLGDLLRGEPLNWCLDEALLLIRFDVFEVFKFVGLRIALLLRLLSGCL